MSVTWMMNGNGTSTTMPVSVRVTTGSTIRIGRSTASNFSSPTYTSNLTVNANNQVKATLSGLSPNTRYYWRVEDNGTLDNSITGTFITDPVAVGNPASFTIGCIGDAGATPVVPGVGGVSVPNRMSNHPIFDYIRQRAVAENWLRVCHLGDICYYDLGSGNHGLSATASVAQYRSMWNDVLLQPNQHGLYRSVPFVYMWDDHDFGPNNSDSTAPGRNNALQVYREVMATPTLPQSGSNPVYHSFQIGRVLFIVSDTRSARVPGSTMLGSAQLSWLSNLLSTSTASALVWLMPTPWLGLSSDTWAGFRSEQLSIVQMLQDNAWTQRMVMVNADAHCLTMTTRQGNPYGNFPISLCASLDATPHNWTNQYDLGMWPGREQYETVRVDDNGADIAITTTAWRRDRVISSLTINTNPGRRIEAGTPSHVIGL